MQKAVRFIAAGTVAAALALSGCASSPSSVAVVDGTMITEREVSEANAVVASVIGADERQTRKKVALDFIMGTAAAKVAERTGVTITDADRETLIGTDAAATRVAEQPAGRAWADAAATSILLVQELGEEKVRTEMESVDVQVNPRYGSWDAQVLGLTEGTGTLSTLWTPETEG